MAVFTFNGNQVAEWESIDDATINGEDATLFGGVQTLSASDTVSFEIDDSFINPDGTLNTEDEDILITIELNGVVIAEDIKLKLDTDPDGKEFGDSFLVTDDDVDLNGDGNPNKIAFSLGNTFTTGQPLTILRDSDGDGSISFDTDFVCFAEGTRIRTRDGMKPVEQLAAGDDIWTLDNGFLELAWIGSSAVSCDLESGNDPPVLIKAGSLGPRCPKTDLIVSSQHRIIVGSQCQAEFISDRACFAPAKALLGLPGVRYMKGKKSVRWFHLAFLTHEILDANGALAESLLLGSIALQRMSPRHLDEVTTVFGAFSRNACLNGPIAREALKVQHVRRTISKAKKTWQTCRTGTEIEPQLFD